MRFQEIRGRSERVGRNLEIAGAVGQDVLGQKLRLADFAVHGAARAWRKRAAIDQLQRRIKLFGEIVGTPTVVGERRNRGEHVLVAALASETCLHAPDGDERTRRHAIALLKRCKQRGVGLLHCAPARDDARCAPLGKELIERQTKTSLAAIGGDGRRRIIRRHQG